MNKLVLIEPHKVYSGPLFPPMSLLYVAASIDPRPDLEWRILDYNAGDRVDPFLNDPNVTAFGITSLTGDPLASAMRIARRIKSARPEVPIIWGGIHTASEPEACLREPFVDIVVPGESEPTLNPLIDRLLAGRPLDDVPGILFKRNGAMVRTSDPAPVDLGTLRPLPFEALDLSRYERSVLYVNTSRGCPHRCDFCCSSVHPPKWRAMPPNLVVDHLARYVNTVRPGRIFFSDYNFFLDRRRALSIASEMIARNLAIPWTAHMVAADVRRLNDDALLLLRGSGCVSVVSGQDGSERLMPTVGKPSTHGEVGDAQQILEHAGIAMTVNYIVGLPGETEDDLRAVVHDIKHRQNRAGELNIYIFNAWPGTPILLKLDGADARVPRDMSGWSDLLLGDAGALRFHSRRHRDRIQTLYYVICLLNNRHIQWFTGRPGRLHDWARRCLGAAAAWRWKRERFGFGAEMKALHGWVRHQRTQERSRRLAEIA